MMIKSLPQNLATKQMKQSEKQLELVIVNK